MAKFRKKPVVIEAVLLERNHSSFQKAYEFLGRFGGTDSEVSRNKWVEFVDDNIQRSEGITIETLEGDHLASWGDYIIKGIKGEFYPCKPDIFEKTYEAV